MISLKQLRDPPTSKEVLEGALDTLKSLGFQVSGWMKGRAQWNFLKGVSTIIADATEIAKTTAEASFSGLARGPWLSELSESRFDNKRQTAKKTLGPMKLVSTASIPYTIAPRQLLVSTDDGVTFINVDGGTIAAGNPEPSELTLTFEAVIAGASGNVDPGKVNRLLKPLAGVTISNEGDPWYTTIGVDEEADATLHRRNETKWPTLSIELVREGYEHLALTIPGIVKVYVDDQNPRGPFTVDVYVAGEFQKVGDAEKAALQALYAKRVLQTDANYPPNLETSSVAVRDAYEVFLDPQGVVWHDPAFTSAEIEQRTEQALDDMLAALPLGGSDYSPGPSNVVALGDLYEVIEGVPGVRSLQLTSPTGDVPVASQALVRKPVSGWGLTYKPVNASAS